MGQRQTRPRHYVFPCLQSLHSAPPVPPLAASVTPVSFRQLSVVASIPRSTTLQAIGQPTRKQGLARCGNAESTRQVDIATQLRRKYDTERSLTAAYTFE